MATFKHNKKKNLLLVWEFFSFHMANIILENKNVEASKETIAKHLFGNRELCSEFELIKNLSELRGIKTQEVAYKMLHRFEEVAKTINLKSCESSKNKLIAEVARLKDDKFYDRKINPGFYRNAALAHTLVSHWMGRPGVSLLEVARLEDYFVQLFLAPAECSKVNENVLELEKTDIDQLVVHVMNNKFNELYSKELNEVQRFILKEWTFVQDNVSERSIEFNRKLNEIRKETYSFIDSERGKAASKGKEDYAVFLSETLTKISSYSNKDMNDDFVAFHLSLVGLVNELQEASTLKESES